MSNKIICNCSNIIIGEKTVADEEISAVKKWKLFQRKIAEKGLRYLC